jgi:hypothetical protein
LGPKRKNKRDFLTAPKHGNRENDAYGASVRLFRRAGSFCRAGRLRHELTSTFA